MKNVRRDSPIHLGPATFRDVTSDRLKFNHAPIAVESRTARSGIGKQLMAAAIDESERRHARKVVLEVRKSNNPAINFYLGFDFRIAGERRNYYSNPVEDAYVMELDISD